MTRVENNDSTSSTTVAATQQQQQPLPLKADFSYDMWSLGCIIYEMHMGKRLFEMEDIENDDNGKFKRNVNESEREFLLRFLAREMNQEWIDSRLQPLDSDVRSLLRRILRINARERLQVHLALEQAYFKGGLTATQADDIGNVSANLLLCLFVWLNRF